MQDQERGVRVARGDEPAVRRPAHAVHLHYDNINININHI